MRVLVTGSGGGVGSSIIGQLRDTGVAVRATCRHPDAQRWPWAETLTSDLDQPHTLRPALQGVDAVFLYSFAQQENLEGLAAEMRAAGVRKVVVLSTIDTTRNEAFVEYNKQRHLAVENAMQDSGFTTVCVRPGAFARNAIRFWANQIRSEGQVRLPFPQSQQAPIADEDIATVAVHALTSQQLDDQKIVLTGPHSLSMREQVEIISQAISKTIDVIEIPDIEARVLYEQILPPKYLELLMGQWAFEVSEPAVVTDAVERITGRPAITYAEWATSHSDAFT